MFHDIQHSSLKAVVGKSLIDYDSIARRLEDSFELIDLVKSCLSTPENLVNMRQ